MTDDFMYKVYSDKVLFDEFTKLSIKIKELSVPFQNENMKMTHDEYIKWINLSTHITRQTRELISDCFKRIKYIQ